MKKVVWLPIDSYNFHWGDEYTKEMLEHFARKYNMEIIDTGEYREAYSGEERKLIFIGDEKNMSALEDDLDEAFHYND